MKEPLVLDADTAAIIYQGPLENPPWIKVVEFLCDRTQAAMMALSFRLMSDDAPSVGVQAFRGSGKQAWDIFHDRFGYTETFDYDLALPGRILRLSESTKHKDMFEALKASIFDPLEINDVYCLHIGGRLQSNAYLIWMEARDAPLTVLQQSWLLQLAPHIERAVEGFFRTRQAQLAGRLAGHALDRLAVGLVAVDRRDRIVFTNRVGDDILDGGQDLRRSEHRLVVHNTELSEKLFLGKTVAQASRIRGPHDEPVGILIMPADQQDELGPGSRPERAIYLHPLARPVAVPETLVASLFGLSVPQARLCSLLVEGLTLREAADQLGVTENTARTYSKQIFSKLGVSRQADLVGRMLRGVAMLGDVPDF